MIGVLVPTRKRIFHLDRCLYSLSIQKKVSLEIILVIDDDKSTFEFVSRSKYIHSFEVFRRLLSKERLYAVKAFNDALAYCDSDLFIWLTNLNELTDELCLYNLVNSFGEFFPDELGVMALNKESGAAYGMTTKKFIEYNEGEWFHEGYKIHYPDLELTQRAILMGMYAWPNTSRVLHNKEARLIEPTIDGIQKYLMKTKDKILYRNRRKSLFYLPEKKIVDFGYDFKEFKISLRGEINNGKN